MASYTAGTFSAKPSDIKKDWVLIDAKNLNLGRLAARVALILRGKNKVYFTPHINCGDSVIIINADQIKLTGKKLEKRKFYWYTGHPGGIKERTIGQILSSKYPERVLSKAIERMMPKESPLARQQLKNLYIYAGSQHPHLGQQPVPINITI